MVICGFIIHLHIKQKLDIKIMQEENKFVSIENGKLLKELGYDIPCKSRFPDIHPMDNTCSNIEDTKEEINWNARKDSISIPVFEDVRKWLHDKYQIHHNVL